jgi:gluconokinase
MMRRFVVMGVSGSGKTSIGMAFAAAIGARFIDGDELHSDASRRKMAAGQPLTDEDRAPWLHRVGAALRDGDGPTVIGCSALKRRYRDIIRAEAGGSVCFLHLAGPREVLAERMSARQGHFMPPSLLDSQLATLEPPGADEAAVTVDIDQAPEAMLAEILEKTGWRTS